MGSGPEALDVTREVARMGRPDVIVQGDAADYSTDMLQGERVSVQIGMKRQQENQWRGSRLQPHFVELIDQEVGVLSRRKAASLQHRQVVRRSRIRDRQDPPGSRLEPYWLVIEPPVHEIAIAGFVNQSGVRMLSDTHGLIQPVVDWLEGRGSFRSHFR